MILLYLIYPSFITLLKKIMNIVINKLKIPEDIMNYMMEFVYTKNGYNFYELIVLRNLRKKYQINIDRINAEYKIWHNMCTSISWLKGSENIYGGVYKDTEAEMRYIYSSNDNLISSKKKKYLIDYLQKVI